MDHSLGNIFRYANYVQTAHAGRQEHHRQHPVLRFTHRFGEGEVVFHDAVGRGGCRVIWRIFHQGRAKDDHHQHDSAPDNEGFFQANGGQQVGINEFEPQAAETIGANGEGGDQPFTFREPFHAVRQGQQVTGAVRQPHQHARAQPQHH